MNKPTLLYLHGFMSSGSTLKGRALAQRYGEQFAVCLPTYPQLTPQHSIDFLLKLLQGAESGVLVGSSLGGFYAQYLGHVLNWPVVLINPALDLACVSSDLSGCHTNPFTGEEVMVDEKWFDGLMQLQVAPVRPSLVLLCQDDATVRPDCALQRYRGIGEVVLLPEGGHACWPLTPVWPCLDAFLTRHFAAEA